MSNFKRSWIKNKPPGLNPELVNLAVPFECTPKHGYYGFKLYFPEEGTNDELVLKNVKVFEKYLERNRTTYDLDAVGEKKVFALDYKSLVSDQLCTEWEDFQNNIVNCTEFCLNCMGLAMHQTIIKNYDNDGEISEEDERIKCLGIIRARLGGYEPVQQVKDIRVQYFGKLISVRGTVIRCGNRKLMCQYLAFRCNACTGVQVVKQAEGNFTPPNKCITDECRAQSHFKPLHSSHLTQSIAWKSIKLQELIGSVDFEKGKVPRTLECELTADLVKTCMPADDVTVTGIIKARNNQTPNKNKQQNTVFQMYLHVLSVTNSKNQSQGSYGAAERITFNTEDYSAIQAIHAEPQLFRFLVQSLCPNIYGHEVIKAGLLLALFGGTKSTVVRAESHVLMMGDPGLGKSQMLQACTNVAPRGVYVCGNTSTNAGLTVTTTREAGGEYALEAGALMLADQGCCCIDEFDKMPIQHACLLEAMEQQSISIAKAGIVCSLPTRATILAAANPAGGHYNKDKTVAENLKISSPMLSRFDLIFILLDKANEELDMKLTEHVLALHSGRTVKGSLNTSSFNATGNNTLRDRLRLKNGEDIDHLPHSLFRKYIAYAQKYVNPILSYEAKSVLKKFYLELRQQFKAGDSTPITTRQLFSLLRLTQARAKAELREEASEADALDVIEIMKESLIDIFTDELGVLDTTRSQNSSGMSTKKQVMQLLQVMQRKSENENKLIFTTAEIRSLSTEVGISPMNFFQVLDKLNIQGFILSQGSNRYKLQTAYL